MKRDPSLHGLSHQHHYALVLARHIRLALEGAEGAAGALRELERESPPWFDDHFVVEEELLLPALEAAGHAGLSARVRSEHERLRALHRAARGGGADALAEFAAALHEHVRFEESELFPLCESVLPASVLSRVAARTAEA
jgi:hypothetical protein